MLDALAQKFGTDKGSAEHNYVRHYERFFDGIRHSVRSVLEFGIDTGASLRMWEEYFPNALITGVDIDPARLISGPRIRCFQADQDQPEQLQELLFKLQQDPTRPLDIVIDDGGHTMSQQKNTFLTFFMALRPGGIYVVEDLHTSYWDHCGGAYRKPDTMIEILKDLVDHVNMFGKSRFGDPKHAEAEIRANSPHPQTRLETALESIHFYKSIAFLVRRP